MSEVKPHKPSLVVFVHGFDSSTDCWAQLLALLAGDDDVAPRFDLAVLSYETARVAVFKSLPPLPELADQLADLLENDAFRGYRDITLVGHSMGGLVIQTYIAARLQAGRGGDLSRLRQVILFATPNLGSMKYDSLRRFFGALFPNLQEERLRAFDPETSSLRRYLARKAVDADERGEGSFPVPFLCFYGEDDSIVPKSSAEGEFDNVLGLPGDHSSVVRPALRDDPRYAQLVDYLLEPAGHRNFFEVEEWGVSVRVEPREPGRVFALHGDQARELLTDNYARLTRWVKFSRRNRCDQEYELSYKTREGWVTYATSHRNRIGPQIQRAYDDHGTNACFKFKPSAAGEDGRPAAGDVFRLDVDIYKGFDEGERDLHFHLGDYQSVYHRIVFRLDLSAYVSAGYDVTDEPKLYLRLGQNTCKPRHESERGAPRPATRDPRGLWEWEISAASDGVILDGVIEALWDVSRKP